MTKLDRMLGRLTSSCSGRGWDLYAAVRGIHEEKQFKVKAEWRCHFKKDHPDLYDPPDITKESTFAECVTWTIHKGRRVVFDIYDGDNMYGHRLSGGSRCTFTVYKVPARFLAPLVKSALRTQAIRMEEREERARREARADEIYKELCK